MYNLTRNKEHLYSSMRFQGDGRAVRVPLTFDLREGDGLAVDFGRGLVNNYKLDDSVTPKVLVFDEPLPKGATVTIRRLTYIEKVPHIFQWLGNAQGGADFSAVNIDENFEQITRASQDAMDAQVLASQTMEEMAGVRDDALEARDRAVLAETNAKESEVASKASEKEARKHATNAADSADSAKSSEEIVKPLHKEVVEKSVQVSEDTEETRTNAALSVTKAKEASTSASQADASAQSAKASEIASAKSEVNAKQSEVSAAKDAELAKQWADKAEEISGFDPTLYRKKDDLVFKGLMQVHAPDDKGTGIFFIDPSGKPRGQVTSNSVGLQFAQYHKDGTAQTFTLPRTGGELTTTALLNTKQDKLTFKGTGDVVRESVTDTLESSVYQAQLSANTALQTAQSKQDKLEFIGSGKVMKEGAYGVGVDSFQNPHDFNGFYRYHSVPQDPSADGTFGVQMLTTANSMGQIGFRDCNPGEIIFRHRVGNNWASGNIATEAWVKSQGYITAAEAPKGLRLGPEEWTAEVVTQDSAYLAGEDYDLRTSKIPDNAIYTRSRSRRSGSEYYASVGFRRILN